MIKFNDVHATLNLWLMMKANCLLKLRINYQYICRVP